jgi:hypothetical protein
MNFGFKQAQQRSFRIFKNLATNGKITFNTGIAASSTPNSKERTCRDKQTVSKDLPVVHRSARLPSIPAEAGIQPFS